MEEKPKRKAISKKLRFEVFKRDSFTCQYCGRKAPDVVLEVDHIKPVAQGGTNTILNLITSCRECNRGKGKKKLSENQTLEKERNQLEALQQRKEQLRMMMQWKDKLLKLADEQINYIEKLLLPTGKTFNERGRKRIAKQIDRFGFDAVVESAIIAERQYEDLEERIQKLGGIAYNITHKDE